MTNSSICFLFCDFPRVLFWICNDYMAGIWSIDVLESLLDQGEASAIDYEVDDTGDFFLISKVINIF